MADRVISFTVLGRPQPAGSKRAFAHKQTGKVVVVDDAKGSRPWKQQVAGVAAAFADELLTGPLRLDLHCYLARPRGHYRTGANAHLPRPSAPAHHVVKPDATKLLRAVEDALTGVLWRDDAQVVYQVVTKSYGAPERVEVQITELHP